MARLCRVKAERIYLFDHLKLSRFNDIALQIADLENIKAPVKIRKRQGYPLIGDSDIFNFLPYEAKNNNIVRLFSLLVKLKVNVTGCGIRI